MDDTKTTDASQNGGKTILIVEDDPVLSKMYSAKFESEGFKVLSAEDGETGLVAATAGGVDFIILDFMMPKMSGTDLLVKLRADAKGKSIPVIVLTNLSEASEKEKASKYGVKEYVIKANTTPSELTSKVLKYLG